MSNNLDSFAHNMINSSELCSVHGQRISLTSSTLQMDYEGGQEGHVGDRYTWRILEFGHHIKRLDELASGHTNIINIIGPDSPPQAEHDSQDLRRITTKKSIRTILTPSIFPRHRKVDLFQEDVITALPYREIKMDNMRANLCFLDQERIITAVSLLFHRCQLSVVLMGSLV